MAVLLTPFFLQFVDDNGVPVAGGKVYTYSAGTTTPKATFTDFSEVTQAANPIILDSAGRATIWISGSYAFELRDANDVVIRTTDHVTAFSIPDPGASAFFQSLSGDGATTVFTLSASLGTDEKALLIFVNNGGWIPQNPNAFTVSGTSLTFVTPPPNAANNVYVFAPSLLLGAAATSATDAATSATNAAASAVLASQWATLTSGLVAATDDSAKAYAIGGTGVTATAGKGAAKEWATKTSAAVDTVEFSAKEYAQGAQAATGGSAKNWAKQTGADVTGASANDRSAKSWAQEAITGATLGGSAKDWAQSASKPDGTSESAKTYASNASASATAAASSATAAASSATSASSSATTATTQASNASSSASAASSSATAAASSATSASSSATTATTQASNAATSATNAATSATNASNSASAASTSASNAATSETNAANSATAAAASATSAATIAAGVSATSTTSLLIAVASKTFTTQSGKQFQAGMFISAVSAANNANYMHGQVTSYSGTSLVINVLDIGGSGTFADWNIAVSGSQGSTGATGASGSVPVSAAAGSADAITATFSPPLTLADKTVCMVIAASANTLTNPTFAPDGLAAKTIKKNAAAALVAGDIAGSGHALLMEYNLAGTYWTLLNPAWVAPVPLSYLDTDTTLAANSDAKVPSQKAIKSYVDSIVAGLSPKPACRLATAAALAAVTYANGTLGVGATITFNATGTNTVDGSVTALNDYVLVKDQASAFQNGIYKVTTAGAVGVAGVWTRATEYDTSAEIVEGTYTVIEEGTANAGALFIMTHSGVITVGTTAIDFTRLTVSSIAASALTGTTLASNVVTSSITTLGSSASLPGNPTTTTQAASDNSTKIATTAYADAAATAGGGISLALSTGTAAINLDATYKGKTVELTGSTSRTWTFTAAATLGASWSVILANNSTAELTLDPNASETIDGLTTFKMYPGEKRLVCCNGSSFTSFVLKPFYLTIAQAASPFTFTKPPGYLSFGVRCGGAGGSGANGSTQTWKGGGGGGGSTVEAKLAASKFSATETVTVGAGGVAVTGSNSAGNVGNNTTVTAGSITITAYGGGPGGVGGGSNAQGAGGGGYNGVGLVTGIGGGPAGSAAAVDNTGFGGAGGGLSVAGANAVWGGGGAGGGQTGASAAFAGGTSVYGGGGGSGGTSTGTLTAGGVSQYGGNGGAAGNGTNNGGNGVAGTDGYAGGGGGGTSANANSSGTGGNGSAAIWGIA